uniref:P/Homo B domain-containing protein n=1 Tax=Panagrolaimus superbus TaxID=310955 RepID=A0A914ZFZ0_9BILA
MIIPDDNYFLFIKHNVRTKSSRKARRSLDRVLGNDGKVLKLEQQVAKKRVKRGYQKIVKRHERSSSRWNHHYGLLGNSIDEDFNEVPRQLTPFIPPNDPLWPEMWYLHRSEQFDGEMDHNVKEAWQLGYTGKGVVVTILDDGLEHTHPDIAPNYDPKASFDVNDRDEDPTPRYDYSDENRHGTRCAGEVASVMNNSMCVVGIAYNSKIGGIRMLDGDVTDAVEAASLSHSYLHIDIYSASWGPDDDGRTVDGPATLTKHAFERGITYGRGGKGSIFIWASGNGGKDADSCNCDGYTNSIYTLSISSATEKGNIPWYSEACSSTLATAYSSGATGEKMIVTTDLHHSCTKTHTGTSASAPLAAGIAALTLEANSDLTWRDLQHIVVRTSRPLNLRAGDWKVNGIGRNVSHSFGYGLLDAGGMVKLARKWNTVPQANKCVVTYPKAYKIIPHGSRLHLQLFTEGCSGNIDRHVKYLEHVQAIVTLKAPKRGDIEIYLISPKGTRSTLLAKRQRDNARSGFTDWAFMTTHNWGEPSSGTWILEIDNDGWDDAELTKWELVLHGTPVHIGDTGYSKESYTLNERSIDALHESNAISLSSLASAFFVIILTGILRLF